MRAIAVFLPMLLLGCQEKTKDYEDEYPVAGPQQKVGPVADLPYHVRRFCDGRNLLYVKDGHGIQVIPNAEECGK